MAFNHRFDKQFLYRKTTVQQYKDNALMCSGECRGFRLFLIAPGIFLAC